MNQAGDKKEEGGGLKTGKLEQLTEGEGWIVDVLDLKKIYIWFKTNMMFFHFRYLSFHKCLKE